MADKILFDRIKRENEIKLVYEDDLFDESVAQNQRKGFVSLIRRYQMYNKPDDLIRLLDSVLTAKNFNTLVNNQVFLYYICVANKEIDMTELNRTSQQAISQKLSQVTQKYFDANNFSSEENCIADDINNTILMHHITSNFSSVTASSLDDKQKIRMLEKLYNTTIQKAPTQYCLRQLDCWMARELVNIDVTCAEKYANNFVDTTNADLVEYIDINTLYTMQNAFRFIYLGKVSKLEIGNPNAAEELRQTNQNVKKLANLTQKLYKQNKIIMPINNNSKLYYNGVSNSFMNLVNSPIVTVEHLIDTNASDVKEYFQHIANPKTNVLNLTNNMIVSLRKMPQHIKSKLEDSNLVDLRSLDYAEELSALTFAIETKLRAIYTIYTKEFIPSLIKQYDKRKNPPYTKEFLVEYQQQLERGAFKDGETTVTIGTFYNKITGQDSAIRFSELKKNIDLFDEFTGFKGKGGEFLVARLLGDIVLYHKHRNNSSHSSIDAVKYNLDVPRVSKENFEEAVTIGLFANNSILNNISFIFGNRIKQWQEKNRQELMKSQEENLGLQLKQKK